MTPTAFDCESFLIRAGLLAPPLVCMSGAWPQPDGTSETILLNRASALVQFRSWLVDPNVYLIAHNFPYDAAVLCDADPTLLPLVFAALAANRCTDTRARQELLDIADGRIQDKGQTLVWRKGKYEAPDYTLAGLEMLHLGRDRTSEKNDPNGWRLRYSELAHLPVAEWPKDAQDYAIADSVGALDVWLAQTPNGRALPTEHDQVRAAFALHLASCWGLRTDGKAIDKLEAALLVEHERIQRRLRKVGFVVPDVLTPGRIAKGEAVETYVDVIDRKGVTHRKPATWKRNTKAIKDYVARVYRRRGLKVPTTKGRKDKATGQYKPEVATDKDTCSQSGSRLLAAYSGDSGVAKVLETYVPALRRGTEYPMNVRFNPIMNTARTSSSSWKDDKGNVHGMNLQNLPTGRRVGGVRECCIPRPGHFFASVDYDTLELRALAQRLIELFGQSAMADALRAGRDLHLEMGARLIGTTYEDALARKKDPKVKEARQLAKAANFGLPGGLGAKTFIIYARANYGVVLTQRQAEDIKNAYLNQWPEMRLYFNRASDVLGAVGETTYTDPVTGFVRGGLTYTAYCNHQFQHRSAMGAKAALFAVSRACYTGQYDGKDSALHGSRVVNFVHDEIITEVPADCAHEAAHAQAEIMCREMARYIPDVPITASPALMARWYKGAEAKYVPSTHYVNGQLVPWSPTT